MIMTITYLCIMKRKQQKLYLIIIEVMKSSNNIQNHEYLTDNCLLLEGTGDLDHYNCVEKFNSSCPSEPYYDEEIYKCRRYLS